jgi:hypothetical protein
MTLTEDEAIHVAMLPDPDIALAYLEHLQTGRRPSVCQRQLGLRSAQIAEWRAASTVYDAMCSDAEMQGTGSIDDTLLTHIEAGTPGYGSIAKTLLQRRDAAYADRSQVDQREHVSIVSYGEAKPEDWEKEAKSA